MVHLAHPLLWLLLALGSVAACDRIFVYRATAGPDQDAAVDQSINDHRVLSDKRVGPDRDAQGLGDAQADQTLADCAALYGALDNYLACPAGNGRCRFSYNTSNASDLRPTCDALCQAAGQTCYAAWETAGEACSGRAISCSVNHGSQMCECAP